MAMTDMEMKRLMQLIAELREMGCAVAVFTASELADVDADSVEDRMTEAGWDAIDALRSRSAELINAHY
jgi:hypothetical protein